MDQKKWKKISLSWHHQNIYVGNGVVPQLPKDVAFLDHITGILLLQPTVTQQYTNDIMQQSEKMQVRGLCLCLFNCLVQHAA